MAFGDPSGVFDPTGDIVTGGRIDKVNEDTPSGGGGITSAVGSASGGCSVLGISTAQPLTRYITLVEIQFDTGWEYFSFDSIAAPSQFYEPLVLSIGQLHRSAPPLGTSQISDVEIILLNSSQYFTHKKGGSAPGKYFYSRKVRILHGDLATGLGSMHILFTGQIYKWNATEDGRFSVTARDISYNRFRSTVKKTLKVLDSATFPNLPASTEPRIVPVVYGNCDIDPSAVLADYDQGGPIPCYLIDDGSATGSGKFRYVVAQHQCKQVKNIFQYGKPISSTNPTLTWTLAPTSRNDQYNDIAWSPQLGIFCAVAGNAGGGTGAVVMVSSDGVNWATYPTAGTHDWRAIAWSPELGLFAAVAGQGPNGGGGAIMTSPDGKNWTARTPPSTRQYNDIIWASEIHKFVGACDFFGGGFALVSTDGITWLETTVAAGVGVSFGGVAWSPALGLLVLVAYNTTLNGQQVYTSPDGITWTVRTTPSPNQQWFRVTWSPTLGIFAAVATNGTNRVMTSANGITWALQTAPAAVHWRGLVWASGPGLFVAVGDGGVGNNLMVSSDGVTWSTSVSNIADYTWVGVAYAPDLGIFAAVNALGGAFCAANTAYINYTVVNATYGGVSMTCVDFVFDPRTSNRTGELEITASVQGITDTGLTSGTLLTHPIDVLQHFLLNYTGTVSGEIDSKSFTIAKNQTAAYQCAMPIVQDDALYSDIIDKWCESFLGNVYITKDAKFGAFIQVTTNPPTSPVVLTNDIGMVQGGFQVASNEDVASTIQARWLYNWTRETDGQLATNPVVWNGIGQDTALGGPITKQYTFWYVRDYATMNFVIISYGFIHREEVTYQTMEVTTDLIDAIDLTNIITISHWQGIGSAGFSSQLVQVIGLDLDLNADNVHLTVHTLALP